MNPKSDIEAITKQMKPFVFAANATGRLDGADILLLAQHRYSKYNHRKSLIARGVARLLEEYRHVHSPRDLDEDEYREYEQEADAFGALLHAYDHVRQTYDMLRDWNLTHDGAVAVLRTDPRATTFGEMLDLVILLLSGEPLPEAS